MDNYGKVLSAHKKNVQKQQDLHRSNLRATNTFYVQLYAHITH